MPLINHYQYKTLGGDMPLNGKTQTFTTTAATSAGDFLYYATDNSGKVTPFVSGTSTSGLTFVGVAKTSTSGSGTVTAYVHRDFELLSWKTVYSGYWSRSAMGGGTFTFAGATLNSAFPLRITGTVAPGSSEVSFTAKEIGSSSVTLHSWSGSSGGIYAGGDATAKFTNGSLTFYMSAGQGNQCGSSPLSCTIRITKIEQYY